MNREYSKLSRASMTNVPPLLNNAVPLKLRRSPNVPARDLCSLPRLAKVFEFAAGRAEDHGEKSKPEQAQTEHGETISQKEEQITLCLPDTGALNLQVLLSEAWGPS